MTLRGGHRRVTHTFLLLFEKLFLMLLDGKLYVTKQEKASKDPFFHIHLIFQSNLGLKISHQNFKTSQRGVGKVPQKRHVLFELPIIFYIFIIIYLSITNANLR